MPEVLRRTPLESRNGPSDWISLSEVPSRDWPSSTTRRLVLVNGTHSQPSGKVDRVNQTIKGHKTTKERLRLNSLFFTVMVKKYMCTCVGFVLFCFLVKVTTNPSYLWDSVPCVYENLENQRTPIKVFSELERSTYVPKVPSVVTF